MQSERNCFSRLGFQTVLGSVSARKTTSAPIADPLDQIDRKILRTFSNDGRLQVTELTAQVGLFKTPCQLRLKRLRAQGFVEGFRAILNPDKRNLMHVAFAEVKLRDTSEKALSAFNTAVPRVPEFEQCHMFEGGV